VVCDPSENSGSLATGVPRSYETAPPWDPTVAICQGPCGGPGGGAVSYERGTPVPVVLPRHLELPAHPRRAAISNQSSDSPHVRVRLVTRVAQGKAVTSDSWLRRPRDPHNWCDSARATFMARKVPTVTKVNQRFHFCFETLHSRLFSVGSALLPERQSRSKGNPPFPGFVVHLTSV